MRLFKIIDYLKKEQKKTKSICAPVLKADVHGLKMEYVAPALYDDGARHFFVAELYEAISLRDILPHQDARIFTLAGILEDEEIYFKTQKITPCINCIEQLDRWNKFCKNNGKDSAIVHLDTHMNRLGLLDNEVEILGRNYEELTSHLDIEFYMSHFYDIKGDDFTNCEKQIQILNKYLKVLPEAPITLACTDSVILLSNKQVNFDMIRPGIGLVGGAPNAMSPISPESKHTLEIYAKISQIKKIPKGQTVGYGGSYTTKKDTTMALVHIGYKDGYLRSLSELDKKPQGVYMVIEGYHAPIIGKISLDATTVDISDIPEDILKEAKYAEVVGPNVDIKTLADIAGCYEIMVALGRDNNKSNDFTLNEFNQQFSY